MAVIRRAGFGSVFEVENETVGIGTTGTATNTVQVLGETRASNSLVAGLSTLTTYQGFVDNNAEFGNSNIDINSQAGTIGDIEICHGDFNVSSASTLTSSVNELTVTNAFSVPTGNTDSRIHCQTAGSMRFNQDLGTLEFYTGDEWRTVNFRSGGDRGVFGQGGAPGTDMYQFIQVSTFGNSVEFGEYYNNYYAGVGGCGDGVRGLWSGTTGGDDIEYLTLASKGNGILFGEMTSSRDSGGSCSDSTRAVFGAGIKRSPLGHDNTMDFVQIQTLGDAIDFGDISFSGGVNGDGFQSPIRGFFHGGGYPTSNTNINVINIASKGNSTLFGDQTVDASYQGAVSSTTRGVFGGGIRYSPYRNNAQLDYVTMASEGHSTRFGDLTAGRHSPVGLQNHVRGCFCGGYAQPAGGKTMENMIDFITIASMGNALYFGEIVAASEFAQGTSQSHGGLGGF
tara:strand:+ start:1006 stop:2364 length:1359 start_codon:yes stop_codon:yes gene_type:complete